MGLAQILEEVTTSILPAQIIIGLVFVGLGILLAKPFVKQQGWLKTGAALGGLILAIPLLGYILDAESRKQQNLKNLLELEMSAQLDEGASITDISVLREQGNNYRGLITAEDGNGEIKMSMDIVYDGDRFIYDIRNSGRVE